MRERNQLKRKVKYSSKPCCKFCFHQEPQSPLEALVKQSIEDGILYLPTHFDEKTIRDDAKYFEKFYRSSCICGFDGDAEVVEKTDFANSDGKTWKINHRLTPKAYISQLISSRIKSKKMKGSRKDKITEMLCY